MTPSIVSVPPIAFLDIMGGSEMLVIFFLVLIFFGGEKMPEFARGLGKALRELRKAASGVEEEFKRAMEDQPSKPVSPNFPNYPATPTILPPAAGTVAQASPPPGAADSQTPASPPPPTPISPAATPEPRASAAAHGDLPHAG